MHPHKLQGNWSKGHINPQIDKLLKKAFLTMKNLKFAYEIFFTNTEYTMSAGAKFLDSFT
jgi:predicted transcriptional regulator